MKIKSLIATTVLFSGLSSFAATDATGSNAAAGTNDRTRQGSVSDPRSGQGLPTGTTDQTGTAMQNDPRRNLQNTDAPYYNDGRQTTTLPGTPSATAPANPDANQEQQQRQ